MKTQFSTGILAIIVLVFVCAMGVAATASAKNPKAVSFEISNNKLDLKSNRTENDCNWVGSKRGCIKVKENEKSEIYFHLSGNLQCTLESGTKWKLNAVYLGGFNSSRKPDKDKFGFKYTSDADFGKVNADFNIADRASGLVTAIEKSDNKFGINNLNQEKYNVWYLVEAICEREDGGDAYITTYDPRVKNEGTK